MHTATPWKVNRNIGRKGEVGIVSDAAPCIIAIMGNQEAWPVEARENAEFIVRAVNCFDELRAACKQCLADVKFGALWDSQGNNPEWVKRMRDAIAKAETP